MKKFKILLLLSTFNLIISCGSSVKLWTGGDIAPPELNSITLTSPHTIVLDYNEDILNSDFQISISEDISIANINISLNIVEIETEQNLVAGKEYGLSLFVFDKNHNSSLYVEKVYGLNPNPATLRINEFTCEGSSSNPDKVEIKVLHDGNLAGFAFQHGALKNFDKRIFFPPIEVKEGDFIVIHLSPSLDTPLKSETIRKTESTHPQAYSTAWDIFVQNDENRGISNSNASISIVDLSHSRIVDAVIYSHRDNDPENKYRGFYRASILNWAEEIVKGGEWTIKDQKSGVMPSDAINPVDSSTTRSISRDSKSTDTNSKDDWHITPTKKSSFGEDNTDEVYNK